MQIIVFTLGDKHYAINTGKVDEISKTMPFTQVPNSLDWVEGLINLRGNVVTLINLCKLLHQDDDKCYNNIIIINTNDEKIGVLVKDIKEVVEIQEKDIQKITDEESEGILGIARIDGEIINVIELQKLI
ncbi:MAG: chemotaxis protein CheW [Eubacteriaceae bacterium]